MSEPEKRIRGGRVRWYAPYYDPSGQQLSRTFDRKVDAQRFLTQIESSKIIGDYIDPARAKITTGTWADKWPATQGHLKPSTRARYEGILAKHVKPQWGSVLLGKMSHADIAGWISGIRLSPASVRNIHRVLYLVLELALRDGRISRNPADGVRLPKATKAEKSYLSHAEVFRLADAAAQYPIPDVGEQYRGLVLVLAFCGLRWVRLPG
jgi:integrase